MMDSRKGGIATVRKPDGGATRGVFYGKINTPGFISANQNCEYQNLKTNEVPKNSEICSLRQQQPSRDHQQPTQIRGQKIVKLQTRRIRNAQDNTAEGGCTRTPGYKNGPPITL